VTAAFDILTRYAGPRIPVVFTEFCAFVGLTLLRGQYAFARVAYDGRQPETPLERKIFGFPELGEVPKITRRMRRQIIARLGRRSGKSTIVGARLLHRALVADISMARFGDVPRSIVIAQREAEAKDVLQKIKGIIAGDAPGCEFIRHMIVRETEKFLRLRRPDGALVDIVVSVAKPKGSGARGPSIIEALVDESEFIGSSAETAALTDSDVVDAIRPALIPDGALNLCSTVWPVPSLTSKLFDANYGEPSTALAAMGPTLLMRDNDPGLVEMRDVAYAQHPSKCLQEYDCLIVDLDSAFFPSTLIDAAVALGKKIGTQAFATMASSGVDLAFEADSSAHVIVERHGGMVVVVHIELDSPEPGKPLNTSDICGKYVNDARDGGCTELTADKHYIMSLREAAAPFQMQVLQGYPSLGRQQKTDAYMYARDLLREGALVLPNNPMLISQLKSALAVPQRGGSMTFVLPRRAGMGHADLVPALLNALWHDRRHGAFRAGASPMQAPQAIRGGWEF
jgi:hypothetical protein